MAKTTHPRIDDIITGREADGCYVITECVDDIHGLPGAFVRGSIDRWANGDYALAPSHLPAEHAQFLDIETRGLSGKNQIWLVGTAYWTGKTLRIHQFLARDPLEEGTIIKAFFAQSERFPHWISFNGKTFDKTRLLRRAKAHLLSHDPCERHKDIYQTYFPIVKGKNLERQTLGEYERIFFPQFKRERHISGADIPAAYANYINGGNPEPVKDAITHNAYDLVTLTALYLKAVQRGF